ncbi:MAG: hypothetical protein LC794_10820 [Acidobacteria bacterium]|nr:hypothetical protein [Acidobacteriota bacterium]MCA1627160.1 hypothetical protein [Acidobacteriota bacterium]
MTANYSSKKVGGYILALFLILGFTAIASTTAQAQWGRDRDDRYRRDRDYRDDRYRRDRDYRDDRYRRNNFEIARQQGYSYGLNVGAADAQRRQSYNPQRSRYWKNATEGYSSSYGNKGQYKQIFRSAFEQGYREGWQQFAGYGRDRDRRDRWRRGRY